MIQTRALWESKKKKKKKKKPEKTNYKILL